MAATRAAAPAASTEARFNAEQGVTAPAKSLLERPEPRTARAAAEALSATEEAPSGRTEAGCRRFIIPAGGRAHTQPFCAETRLRCGTRAA